MAPWVVYQISTVVLSLDLIITLNIKHTVSFEKQMNKRYVVNVFKATQY